MIDGTWFYLSAILLCLVVYQSQFRLYSILDRLQPRWVNNKRKEILTPLRGGKSQLWEGKWDPSDRDHVPLYLLYLSGWCYCLRPGLIDSVYSTREGGRCEEGAVFFHTRLQGHVIHAWTLPAGVLST